MNNKRNLFSLIAAIAVAGTSMFAQNVGDPAPDFSYQSLSGDTVRLSDYTGKVVFLFLFGNGCPSCKSIGNDTETRVQAVYGSRDDFQALGLDLWNSTSSVTSVTGFKSTTKISYPLLLKAGDMEQKYSTTYDRLLVIDQEGILRHKGKTLVSNDLGNAISIIEGLFATTSIEEQVGSDGSPGISIYPNPVNEHAGIHFTIGKESLVDIRIYNLTGQELIYMGEETIPAGSHMRELPAGDLTSGVYVLRMVISGKVYTRRMLVN